MKKILLLVTVSFTVLCADAQYDKKEFKAKFHNAFDSISSEYPNYPFALKLFLELDSLKSDDANIMANVGKSYINMDRYQTRAKAVPFLEKVVVDESDDTGLKVDNFNPYYAARDIKEEKAPIEAIWWLAKAYHADEQFENAIKYYNKYLTYIDKTSSDGKRVEKQVLQDRKTSENALALKNDPRNAEVKELATEPSSNVNTEFPDYRPLINADESILYFTSRRYGSTGNKKDADSLYFEDIYYTVKKDGVWQDAQPIGEDVNGDEHEATVSLTADGNTMFVYTYDDATDGDISLITYDGEHWSEKTKIDAINTQYWESHATMSLDGNLMIFSSDRPVPGDDGTGFGLELYQVKKDASGNWGAAERFTTNSKGISLNTEFDENCPYLHPDGKTLYFSSRGHNSMGGYDVFKSVLDENGEWGAPVNMGYPVNTVGEDVFFQPSLDGRRGYFSSYRDGGKGDQDIYIIELDTPTDIALIKGCVGNKTTENLNQVDDFEFVIYANGVEFSRQGIDSKTGLFSSILQTDLEYTFEYNINGVKSQEVFTAPGGEGYIELNKTVMLNGQNIEINVLDASVESQMCFINPPIDTIVPTDTLIIRNLNFVFDKTELIDQSIPDLELVFAYMDKYPTKNVRIEGHTDSKGSDAYNVRLAKRRSEAIKNIMVKRGVDPKRISTKGFGEKRPVAPNTNPDGSDNPEGRQLNRRIEFIITD